MRTIRVSHLDLLKSIGYILFGMMLIFPYKFQPVKALLLLAILFYAIVLAIRKTIFISSSKKIVQWLFLYVFANMFFICYGFFLKNPAPQIYFNIYCVWPVLFVFTLMIVDKSTFYGIIKCMRYSLLVILLFGILAFFKFNIELMREGDLLGFIATIRPGFPFIAISGGAVTNMIFLYFFFLSLCVLKPKFASKIDWCNVVLGLFFAFFTSRRALFLDFLLSFILIGILMFFLDKKERSVSIRPYFRILGVFFTLIILVVSCLSVFDLFQLNDFADFVSSAVGDDSSDPRIAQTWSLLEGWSRNPILGNGTGINASVIRSELPGTYELTYLAMLFERGLIGTSLFWFQYFILNCWAIQCFKKKVIPSYYIISLIVALNLFMIANATNPYLGAFDHIVFLFLLFIVINLSNKKEYENLCLN